jgi:hypothetical protein
LKDGRKFRFFVPSGSFITPEQFEHGIYNGMIQKLESKLNITSRKRRALIDEEGEIEDVEDVIEETEAPVYSTSKAKEEAERKAREKEAKRKAKEEADRKAREEEAKRRAREEEAKRKAKEETDRKAREEEVIRKAKEEETKRKAKEEADRKAREEAARKQQEEVIKNAQEAARLAEVDRKKQEEETKRIKQTESVSMIPVYGQNKDGLSYGVYRSIYTVEGKDPHPELHYMHEKDRYFYVSSRDKYMKKYNLKIENFVEHVQKNIEEFKEMFEREEYNEDYSNKSEQMKREILEIAKGIQFYYLDDISRFKLKIANDQIADIVLSDQLSYVLGYEKGQVIRDGEVAKYMVDLHGGVSHLCVYLNSGLMVL